MNTATQPTTDSQPSNSNMNPMNANFQKKSKSSSLLFRKTKASTTLVVSLSIIASSLNGCFPKLTPKPPVPSPMDLPKCDIIRSQARPLIVEWHSADRGALESLLRKTAVAVSYKGCQMEVLQECRIVSAEGVPTGYLYEAVTTKHDKVTMRNRDQLYANIPLGAPRLEVHLQQSGQLNVAMTIVGRYELTTPTSSLRPEASNTQCANATHVVRAITTGAFTFFAGAEQEIGGGVGGIVGPKLLGGETASKYQLLNKDGDPKSCDQAAHDDQKPPTGCGALLRLEVVSVNKGYAWGVSQEEIAQIEAGLKVNAGLRVGVDVKTNVTAEGSVDGVGKGIAKGVNAVQGALSTVANTAGSAKVQGSAKVDADVKVGGKPVSNKGLRLGLIYGGFGLGVAGLVTGLTTGLMVRGKADSLKRECDAEGQCPDNVRNQLNSARTLGTVSTVSFILSGVGIATGLVGIFAFSSKETPSSSKPSTSAPNKKASISVQPIVGLGFLGLGGSF